MKSPQISIIGGGIAGLTTAIGLRQKGFETIVFEAASAIRPVGAGLVLAVNARRSLEKLGLDRDVAAAGNEMPVFRVQDDCGVVISDMAPDLLMNTFGINNIAIHRAELHRILLEKYAPSSVQTGKKAVDFEMHPDAVEIHFEDGSKHRTDYLIIADGVHSALRQKLAPGSAPRYAGYTCWRGITDRPESLNPSVGFESTGAKGRFGITPLKGGRLYWYACINAPQNSPTLRNWKSTELLEIFRNFPAPIPAILQSTRDEDILWNDVVDIAPLDRFAFERVLLIGDAAHATTPNMAQGACQAIEDAALLSDLLEPGSDVPAVFRRFEQQRLPRTRAIVNSSRILGKISQLENPLLIALRNFSFRMTPQSFVVQQLKKVYTIDF